MGDLGQNGWVSALATGFLKSWYLMPYWSEKIFFVRAESPDDKKTNQNKRK
jgi:hypothetical protein